MVHLEYGHLHIEHDGTTPVELTSFHLEFTHPDGLRIHILHNRDEAARFVAQQIVDLVKEKPDAAISFPTGNQALWVYKELVKLAKEQGVSFANVTAFHLDEYFPISPEHPDSFRRYLRENVFGPLGIKPKNIHEIQADPGVNGDKVAANYEKLIAKHEIDLLIHPIGPGGHMGFNESGSALDSLTRVVKLSDETVHRDQVERNQDSPNYAITQGVATILRAKRIIFLTFGSDYVQYMREALYGPISENNPSSLLRTQGHKVEVVLDKEAATGVLQA